MTPATILSYDGIEQPITEWALDYGITPAIIIGRLERGATIAEAIITPMKTGFPGQRLVSADVEAFIEATKAQRAIDQRKPRKPRASVVRSSPAKNVAVYTVVDKTLSIPEWSILMGIKTNTIRARFDDGWDIERALTTPARQRIRRRGVPADFAPSRETGAWGTAQEMPNITFSEKAESA